ncbi:pyruvate dehydrogenase (acetyl-transferring) E1 component subunit alpha [Tessaracoccus sp. OS52]|uniref:pyruvate dehydrogenase (acetyl-transferring) E1 component subunit alpha n=1 Tax=Tessaracoccus sp. OS52 TaxID=2886691 RepID=UPI001D110F86|nr:pyruvate dehydrogenase (acetyl-transferring) E1 component subunit alpha [Tessaracoccus sp. OS52]MCC2594076.1 pyruvate dehydrogenase (acetyl-transferring) E1 component subunit alpha [Tessaracoccus sp. OS52]
MVQLLTPDGRRVENDEFSWAGTDADLVDRLRDMTMARRFDAEATALQRKGELGMWPPSLGQEAAQVGSARALAPTDMVFPSYREHGVAMCLGIPMRQLLALFRGTDHGDWEQLDRFRNYQIVIGTQALHATGYAMGLQFDGMVGNEDPDRNASVIVYHGDGASSQGDVNEAFVFAASYNAPVVFFCQNNQWAISEPMSLQSRIPLFERVRGFGFPGVQVDGNDVLAVQAVAEWALERARSGEGPTFIEAFTYRMGAHTTSDDPTKYRTDSETEIWKGRDPITRLTTYLREQGVIDDSHLAQLDADAQDYGAEIRSWIQELVPRTMDQLFDDVYAENTVALDAQHREYAEYNAGFEEA